MAKDIRDSINSAFVSKSNLFRSKPKIYVYVEDDIDKAFWYSFLHPYETIKNCTFVITAIEDKKRLLKGKTSLLYYKQESDLGPYLWLCMDSDYDEIVNGFSKFSKIIKRSNYIITTWWYSIENLKCQPELLKLNIMKASLCDEISEDINVIMKDISLMYKATFLLLLEMEEKHDNRFKIDDFNTCLSFITFDNNGLNKTSTNQKNI